MSEHTRRVVRTRTPVRIIRKAADAATSIAKTSVGVNLASPEVIRARLKTCTECPGGHATFHPNGTLRTCGPMVDGLRVEGKAPCGCVLRLKARDVTAECPFGWWDGMGDRPE